MAVFFYNLFLLFFRGAVTLASPFNTKARNWLKGRQAIFERLSAAIPANEKVIWMHCASVGEFEQGRTLIESFRKNYSGYKILLTFFSPSGFESAKNYKGADWIFYLPMDGAKNAKRFLEIVHPSIVVFVKYELWYYYLKKIKYRDIPLILVSALFRKEMTFFRWHGGLQRKMLSRFDHLFVQNKESKNLIDGIGLGNICSISGDTRFDRVVKIAADWKPVPGLAEFIEGMPVLVAGSTWPEDESILQQTMIASGSSRLKMVIAPHEVDEKHIAAIQSLFPGSVCYSQWMQGNTTASAARVLIIDNIGMLSRIYKYGTFTFVGGGFRKMGVHNVLEAAVFNKIVFFGPYYHKYIEAVNLVISGGGLSFHFHKKKPAVLAQLIEALIGEKEDFDARSRAAGNYVRSGEGATQIIMNYIYEKRLLTN